MVNLVGKVCDCGIVVWGINKGQSDYNMRAHKKSTAHKLQLNYKRKHEYD